MPWNTLIAAGIIIGIPVILLAAVYFFVKSKNKKTKSSS